MFISAGASVPGVSWNSTVRPSSGIEPFWLIETLGAIRVMVPVDRPRPMPAPVWQDVAVHVGRAPAHRGAGIDVLGRRLLHEADGRDDLHLGVLAQRVCDL